ncbi:MAG: cell division protein FtsW [Ignavibacteriae bacterium]|nr:cell division protein FtsW [Ignavibacteriota bacterium]
MEPKRNHIDLSTLVSVLMLMVLSLGVVYSASSTFAMEKWGSSSKLMTLHVIKVLASFAAIILFMRIDYKKYRKITKPAIVIAVIFLLVTLALGGEVKGASRWLRLGGLGLQPSEFAKYALLFHICTLFAEKKERIRDFKHGFMPVMIWIGLVTLLVLLQPNFSNGAMIFAVSLVMLFVGRAKISHVALTFATMLPLLVAYMLSAPYRMKRIMAFIGFGEDNGSKVNYQLWQGIIGFGNGGIFGVGPGESKQRDFFLPESYGDFVFSIVGEEYGLIGTLFILALFLTIMLRGMKIAKYAQDDFGRNLAIGITSSITLYALINAGVTLGLLPTTGLPMPFVSYGGSSMLFSSMAIGVLLNISSQTDLHPRFTLDFFRRKQAPRPEPAVGQVF